MLLAVGCGGSPAAPGSGGNGGGDDGGSSDAPADTRPHPIITPISCLSARAVCDGSSVRECVGANQGRILEICSEACSLGRCTTLACKAAESSTGTSGCRFYGAQSDNADSDDGKDTMLILSNSGQTPAAARVEVRAPGGTWLELAAVTVPVQGGARVSFSRPLRDPGVALAGGYRVETNVPVFAVQLISDDQGHGARSSAGTVLRPAQALGFRHLVVTAPAVATDNVVRTVGSRDGAGAITVVATAATTLVRVALSSPAIVRRGGEGETMPTTFDMPMDEGDVLQMFSSAPGGDLTGTSIDADAPLAVFSGNVYTTYGYSVNAFNGGDMAQEQLPPTSSWGKQYVGARLSPQAGCDPWFGGGASMWRIVAADDETTVELVPAPGASIDGPKTAANLNFKLARGGFRTFLARPEHGQSSTSDFLANADKPILLAQWLDCEPGLSWGVDTRLMRTEPLVVTFAPGFDHEVVVVRKRGTEVRLGGTVLPNDSFTIKFDAGFELARLTSADLQRCTDLLDTCEHSFSGTDFGLTWRGMDVVCSYSVVVPPSGMCALPNVNCEP